LINFCLFPEMPFRIRVRLLRVLHNHPGCGAVLECLLRHHPEQHRLLICFIRRLVHDSKSRVADQGDETEALEETDREDCKSFYSSLEAWDLVSRAHFTNENLFFYLYYGLFLNGCIVSVIKKPFHDYYSDQKKVRTSIDLHSNCWCA